MALVRMKVSTLQ